METKELKKKPSNHFRRIIVKNYSDSEELCINRFSRAAISRENNIKSRIQTMIENRKDLIQPKEFIEGVLKIRGHSVVDFETSEIVSYSRNLRILKKIKKEVTISVE